MLDLKFIRDNADLVKKNTETRHATADVDEVVRLYDSRNALISQIESLRQERNENAKAMKQKLSPEERQTLIEQGKSLKERLPALEDELRTVEEALYTEAARIPNLTHPDAPLGEDDEDNKELKRVGEPTRFSFTPKDHVQLGADLDLIDFDTAARVSGTKFYYLKNEAALLELGLARFAMDKLRAHGFTVTITPDIAREEVISGIGFIPRGEESNIYAIEDTDTCLVGTAEITLGGYHAGAILDTAELPIKLAGFSHCFRREAGAAGRFSKGLYRVHQFSKVEMFVYCLPEQSDAMLEELRGIEEEIFTALEVPFRVVDTATGDLGGPAYRKYDLEAWMPGRGDEGGWGEITSTSNCTDYQARRLGTRYRDGKKSRFVHMLNGTAIANSRAIIAILENGQQEDGSVRIPKALVPYCGFDLIPARSS